MPRKRFTVERIINHLREAEVLLSQGQTVGAVCRRIGVSELTSRKFGQLPHLRSKQSGPSASIVRVGNRKKFESVRAPIARFGHIGWAGTLISKSAKTNATGAGDVARKQARIS